MRFKMRFLLLLIATSLVASCSHIPRPSFIENRDTKYLSARSIPPLRIPPGVSSNAFINYYPIPDRHYPPGTENVSIVPPGLAA